MPGVTHRSSSDGQRVAAPALPPSHRALVRACLVEPDELEAALGECFGEVDPSDVDHWGRQLFGLLYRRIVDHDLDHPARAVLGRTYMRTWHGTQRLLFRARPLFDEVRGTGRPPLVLKGGAMVSSAYYDDLGVRPLMDLDILLDRPTVEPLVASMLDRGWRVSKGLDTRDIYIAHHAIDLEDDEGGAVDVHWALLVQGRSDTRDRQLIQQGVPATLGDQSIEVLPPTFQLFHTVAHAKPEGIRHLVDAARIVRQHENAIDWSAIVDETLERRTITYALWTLEQVEQAVPGTVPSEILARLRTAPRHWSDYPFHGEPLTSRRDAVRRLAADVSGRARGAGPIEKLRVARAMVHRFAQSNGVNGGQLMRALVVRGPGGMATGDDDQ